jgi:hypothetical protein
MRGKGMLDHHKKVKDKMKSLTGSRLEIREYRTFRTKLIEGQILKISIPIKINSTKMTTSQITRNTALEIDSSLLKNNLNNPSQIGTQEMAEVTITGMVKGVVPRTLLPIAASTKTSTEIRILRLLIFMDNILTGKATPRETIDEEEIMKGSRAGMIEVKGDPVLTMQTSTRIEASSCMIILPDQRVLGTVTREDDIN